MREGSIVSDGELNLGDLTNFPNLRRSDRIMAGVKPNRHGMDLAAIAVEADETVVDPLTSYADALKRSDAKEWKATMQLVLD